MLRVLVCLVFLAGTAVVLADPGSVENPRGAPRFKAVAFDFLALFNPESIGPLAEQVVPGRGHELTMLWRTRQFEYTWLRSLSGRYADFAEVTGDALLFAADAMRLTMSGPQKRRLLDAYFHLSPWPDTEDALSRLRRAGVRVIALANFSPAMLEANVRSSGLADCFDDLVSTDVSHTYKPDPRAYQLGVDRLHLRKDDILFVASAGWDAAGARAFGYPTFWVNRFRLPEERLGVRADSASPDLSGLLEYVLGTEDGR